MLVKVGMGLVGRVQDGVRVAVVLVMHVRVGVSHRRVGVLVFVMLGQVQPYADGHQKADDAGENDRREVRQWRADRQADDKIERARGQAFELDDVQRIGQGDLAGQIIVETPCQTGPDDRERTGDTV